jgi:hypothetical protein
MRISLVVLSIIIALVKADSSFSIPEVEKVVEGTKIVQNIGDYLEKTQKAFGIFDSQDKNATQDSKDNKSGLTVNKPSFFGYVTQIGTIASTISSGIDLFGKVASFLGFKYFVKKSSSSSS